ncbi:DUF5983 family protein [Lelliottia wanjuensis]|uniref:DUF5983 family protein n=1 Tax=Lelliottia wanjuensis TaxID=3050585 RepID=A0AAP4D3T4_9ENTR|nr:MULTISPECIES: DUF5983 family protein [unclassified Lelliottia]MDK9362950.1 DUF5983 family protein [Lelliottia sp. V106_12]MDK9616565.1 DUF5983 family protein [Lelliottia sp. V106_9]
MKISLNVEADSVNVLALNMGKIAVEVDGIELAQLIDVVNDNNSYFLRIADEPGKLVVEDPLPPIAHFTGIQCSTAHITEGDNTLLRTLSQPHQPFDDTEWNHYTGSGYLIRLDAWAFPLLQLKRRGLSRACRKLVVTLIRRYGIACIHLDAFAETLPCFPTFNW